MSEKNEMQGERSPGRLASQPDLMAIATAVHQSVEQRQGDSLALLALLRLLESLHKEIQEGIFQDRLPTNRQGLYALLRDMEAQGGWPYIPRMKLQAIMTRMLPELLENGDSSEHENSLNR
ncbi:MAG TPA: hypothetical protein V6C78_28105 [Crinalium sp.]